MSHLRTRESVENLSQMCLRLFRLSSTVIHMGQADPVSVGRLSDVVAKELTALGYTTVRAQADAIGITKSTLNRRLKKPQQFTAVELFGIAAVLGIRASDLVGAAEDAA